MHDERNKSVRIIELIGEDEAVMGGLLRLAVEMAEQEDAAEVVKCDVSAHSPRIQETLLELGFLPAGYVPGMVFHGTGRMDVVKMMKLNVAWDLGPIELTEPSQKYYDLVAPAFEQADARRAQKTLALTTGVLAGFSPVEADLFQRACQVEQPPAGAALAADSLHIVLEGQVRQGGQTLAPGQWWGAEAILRGQAEAQPATAGRGVRVLSLSPGALAQLAERHPRLAVKLYRNLAGGH
jgi:hypothetical protein